MLECWIIIITHSLNAYFGLGSVDLTNVGSVRDAKSIFVWSKILSFCN